MSNNNINKKNMKSIKITSEFGKALDNLNIEVMRKTHELNTLIVGAVSSQDKEFSIETHHVRINTAECCIEYVEREPKVKEETIAEAVVEQ